MIAGIQLGIFVEAIVSVLLLLTLGYCVILNQRLKLLHADKESLRLMITDLMTATNLAQKAVGELRATANECDAELTTRVERADEMQGLLAKHVLAGQNVMNKLAKVSMAAGKEPARQMPETQQREVVRQAARQIPKAPRKSVAPSLSKLVAPVVELPVTSLDEVTDEADFGGFVVPQPGVNVQEQETVAAKKDQFRNLFAKLEAQRARGTAA